LTWDQGRETVMHEQAAAATGFDVNFCDPHSAWQRGLDENTNGLIHQYFPNTPTCRSIPLEIFSESPQNSTSDPGSPRRQDARGSHKIITHQLVRDHHWKPPCLRRRLPGRDHGQGP
jgi:hypothetical protein